MARPIDPIPPLSPRSRWEAPPQPPADRRETDREQARKRDARRRAAQPSGADERPDGARPAADETIDEPPSGHRIDVRA